MSKRSGKLLGEYGSSNPVEAQRKKEKAQQRKRQRFVKTHPTCHRDSAHDPEQQSVGVEDRAAAWKSKGASSSVAMNAYSSSSWSASLDAPTDPHAKWSIYYDPVSNASGQPPSCKPAAYRHPDGVIRAYPPRRSVSGSDYSSESDGTDSSDSVDSHPIIAAPSRPAPPRPVTSVVARPPPRPGLASAKAGPLLPG